MKGVGTRRRIVITFLAVGFILASLSPVFADEIDRIREKCEELAAKVEGARYDALGMGEKSQMDRVHRDYAYLLGSQKVEQVAELVAEVTDPAEKALQQQSEQRAQIDNAQPHQGRRQQGHQEQAGSPVKKGRKPPQGPAGRTARSGRGHRRRAHATESGSLRVCMSSRCQTSRTRAPAIGRSARAAIPLF